MLDVDAMLTLSGGSAEMIEPGKSLMTLIRPTRWDASLWRHMTSGDYRVRVHYRGPGPGVLKEMQRVWPDKPLAGVWSGDVVSTLVSFEIARDRARQPSELVWSDPVDGLQAGMLVVPECPIEPLTVNVRVPGFEESRFLDVAVQPNAVTPLTLTLAEPVRLRLVDDDGKPVAGAAVRYFNRSKFDASAGHYPTEGRNGAVWATSNDNGEVVLDTSPTRTTSSSRST